MSKTPMDKRSRRPANCILPHEKAKRPLFVVAYQSGDARRGEPLCSRSYTKSGATCFEGPLCNNISTYLAEVTFDDSSVDYVSRSTSHTYCTPTL